MTHTTDPQDPRLSHGVDDHPVPQSPAYLVLSDAERAKGFVRPVRHSYVHSRALGDIAACGTRTTMSGPIAETYARQPSFYGSTYCIRCKMHLPVACFTWDGTDELVGS